MDKDTQAYLDRIRKTIAESKDVVAQAELRIAETDRMLERQGLTREQVMAMRFSDAQMEAVNAELKRRGLDPFDKWAMGNGEPPSAETQGGGEEEDGFEREASDASYGSLPTSSSDAELENRQRKFGMMMKPFQI